MARTNPERRKIESAGVECGSKILGTGFSRGVLAVHNPAARRSPRTRKRIPAALRATPSHSTPLKFTLIPLRSRLTLLLNAVFPGIRPGRNFRRLDDREVRLAFQFLGEMLTTSNWPMKLLLGSEKDAGWVMVRPNRRYPVSLPELQRIWRTWKPASPV